MNGKSNGRAIKEMRSRLHFSQQELANRLGVTRAAVGQWESNLTNPNGSAFLLLKMLAKKKLHDESWPESYHEPLPEAPLDTLQSAG